MPDHPRGGPARYGGVIVTPAPRRRLRFRPRTALAAALAAVLGAPALALVPASPAAAYPYADVTLLVHGWGHGRGMGQWGAFGYSQLASPSQSTYQAILGHYYGTLAAGGSTSLGQLPAGNPENGGVRIDLTWNDGNFPIVTSAAPFTVGGHPVAAGQAVEIVPVTAGAANIYLGGGSGCGGPWPGSPTFQNVSPTAAPVTAPAFPSDGHLATEVLQLCRAGSNQYLRGTITATMNSANADRTVDTVPLDHYVADSAPAESPSSWGTVGGAGPQGQPWGFQSTEAQVVATRSYVASRPGGYGGYADTCDSTACQSYPGITDENATDDLAAADTAGQVVLLPGGTQVATTEYSASTGGWTAPGTFAAVADLGDAVCLGGGLCNPHHQYTVTIPVSAILGAFPQLGTLESLGVTQRNGFGDFGGRVLQMTLVGSGATVNLTGNGFSADFSGYGLGGYALSNWFNVASQPSGGVGGYWLLGSDGGVFSFGNAQFHGSTGGMALNAPVVGMAATADHGGYWLDAADGGVFSYGDAGFHGSMGGIRLNAPVVGMTPGGQGYRLVAADGGIFSFGAPFYGSMGGTRLNAPVVSMAGSPDGRGYWLVAADGGIFAFGDAAFEGSLGGTTLNAPVVSMAATADGRGYWLVAADGGIFAYGDAAFKGSLPGSGVTATAVAVLPTATAGGYLIITADGRAIPYGDAPQFGDPAGTVAGWTGRLTGGVTVPG